MRISYGKQARDTKFCLLELDVRLPYVQYLNSNDRTCQVESNRTNIGWQFPLYGNFNQFLTDLIR